MAFFIIILFALIIMLFVKNSNLKARVSKMESEMKDLRECKSSQTEEAGEVEPDLTYIGPVWPVVEDEPKMVRKTLTESEIEAAFAAKMKAVSESSGKVEVAPVPREPIKEPAKKSEFLVRLEKQLVENWTGILGAVVMVMGVGFLGIYAALIMDPIFRFLMILCFGALLFGIGLYAGKKEKWVDFSQWLKSSGAAIILFSCLGAGNIEGLKWIDDRAAALVVLIAGICVNLFIGFYSGRQFAASFHTILSLVALIIAPQSFLTLGIAASVTILSIVLTRRSQWEYHLLVTITSFMLFHGAWYFILGQPAASAMPLDMRITGICALLLTGSLTALVPYSSVYRDVKFDTLPFIVHLLNWFYMALGFLVYSTGSKWNTIILIVAACAVYMLSRFARRLKIEWLRVTDVFISQAIVMFAIYTLGRWGLEPIMIIAVFMSETLIFFYMMVREDIGIGKYIGVYLYHLSWILLIICSASLLYASGSRHDDMDSVFMLGMLLAGLMFNVFFEKNRSYIDSLRWYSLALETEISLSGVFIGILALLLYGHYYYHIWAGYAFMALSLVFMVVRQRMQSSGLGIGLIIVNVGAYVIIWANLVSGSFATDDWTTEFAVFLHSLPFFLNIISMMYFSYIAQTGKRHMWPAIYLLAIHSAITSYCASVNISVFIPGVVWLLISLVFLQVSTFISGKTKDQGNAMHLLINGFMFLIIFLVRHILVHMQSHLYMGPAPVRLVIALFAVSVFLYWALMRLNESSWSVLRTLQSLIWELIIVFTLASVILELSDAWLGIVFISAAFILLVTGNIVKTLSRFRFYALIMAFAASVSIGFVSGTYVTPSTLWHDQGWIAGGSGILVYFGFLFAFHSKSGLSAIDPGPVWKLDSLALHIDRRQNAFLFYPFFVALALFMFWSFDKSVLTLLWVFEAFVIFILSIVFKEQHFRYIAMAGLAGCLVRLVFYDLSKSTTITRAIVFLGVGIIMLLINSLYNKYRDRYIK